MKKFYPLYLFLALFAFASCEKNDPAPVSDPKTANLTGGPWIIEDAIVKMNYTFMGQPLMDTTFSMYKDVRACERDFTFAFKADKFMDIKTGAAYCGEQLPGSVYKWDEKNSYDRLLIIGKGAGGLMSVNNGSMVSISDTLNLKILDISNTNLTGVYEVPFNQMFAHMGNATDMAGMEELFDLFGQLLSGKMEITYKMKRK